MGQYDQKQDERFIIHQLALLYSTYRIILSCSLFLIFLITYGELRESYRHVGMYFGTCFTYIVVSFIQFGLIRSVKVESVLHITLLFLIDISVFSFLIFSLVSGVNLQIGLLYLITILLASILLQNSVAFMITLGSAISITYQSFVAGIFEDSQIKFLSNNIFLTFLFFVAYKIGRVAIERFNILERTALSKTLELEQLQRVNQYILQKVDVGYLLLNKNMDIVISNAVACRLLGMADLISHRKYPLQVWQNDLFDFIHQNLKEEFTRIHQEDFKLRGKSIQFTFYCERSGCDVNIKMQALNYSQETLTLLTLQDTQEIKQQVQQLKLASLGQLSASIAHEIRNPLSAIVQANDLLYDELTEEQQLYAKMISKQAKRIDQIIHDTLNMAKHESTYSEKIDLTNFIEQIVQEDLKDIQQHLDLNLQVGLSLLFDRNQLRQVLINLIRNAVRHNVQQRQVIVRSQFVNGECWLDVIDFGDGVAKHDQRNLFKPFFSTAVNGTGLGLYLSHSFCEANQARLVYIDEPEQGACFRIIGEACLLLEHTENIECESFTNT